MELRKDYVLERWSYIAQDRGKRPVGFAHEKEAPKSATSLFSPGNEEKTPAEIGRREHGGKWYFRWFPNKFPAVNTEGQPGTYTADITYSYGDAYGHHEVIVETPDAQEQLWDLSPERIRELLEIYQERIEALSTEKGIAYVQVFKNHGKEAGASLPHAHSQLVATSIIPPTVLEKAAKSIIAGECRYCHVISREKSGERRCFENESAVAFSPYAPRANYECWVFPKRHVRSLAELAGDELQQLAGALHFVLQRLKLLGAPFNYYLHYSPPGRGMHAHIEVLPRLNTWAGFELGTGSYIITVPPEEAARFYREGK